MTLRDSIGNCRGSGGEEWCDDMKDEEKKEIDGGFIVR